ncbi:amidase [Roseococcus sp. SDR]|uniref:amidase n=1 Tax=Roseococcus sp. SDR TaxID=2835532 RepID=UPI001BCDD36E|nr:amidase [Roseococcus sp. SDR]MBS7791359.1 amidase [Roseococcus sp. SDR]MBV1846673.1 amidase [Roseococcus sp. SDR]
MARYHPKTFAGLTWHDATAGFREGRDSPRAYLERCLGVIAAREEDLRAFVVYDPDFARQHADDSTARWQAGNPLSAIDGMPIGIKDLIETRDFPTQMGCAAYAGNFPRRDSAMIQALKQAGAIILGKTVTTELGQSEPGPTKNPFDATRTPGGSSSGSAAAVAAGMVPAAIGTQVGGSIIRPAAFCGNIALKPTQGGIHRGERQGSSQSTAGVHANSYEDMWQVAIEIARRAGGDPGTLGLIGPDTPPHPARPQTLGLLETEAWSMLRPAEREAFEALLERIRGLGISVLTDHPALAALERIAAQGKAVTAVIVGFENRWSLLNLEANHPGGLSARAIARLRASEALSVEDYRAALATREEMRAAMARLAPVVDALIAPAAPGIAPLWDPDDTQNPRPTGDIAANAATSALGVPCVTLPVMAVEGMPFGAQVIGQAHQDARATAIAHWLHRSL